MKQLPLETQIEMQDLAVGSTLLRELRESLPQCTATEPQKETCACNSASSTRSASGAKS